MKILLVTAIFILTQTFCYSMDSKDASTYFKNCDWTKIQKVGICILGNSGKSIKEYDDTPFDVKIDEKSMTFITAQYKHSIILDYQNIVLIEYIKESGIMWIYFL